MTNSWYVYDGGSSIGTTGCENGVIIRDEEHPDGARITLEKTQNPPYTIICGVYGWTFHTSFFSSENTSQSGFEEIKVQIEKILSLIPLENDPDLEHKRNKVIDAIEEMVNKF